MKGSPRSFIDNSYATRVESGGRYRSELRRSCQGPCLFNVTINNVALEPTGHTMSGFETLKDVALRPWPGNKSDEFSKDAMLQQVEQLARERGHLRHITEQSLQADIDAGRALPDDAKESSENDEEEKEPQTLDERKVEINKMQMEMAGHLEYVSTVPFGIANADNAKLG